MTLSDLTTCYQVIGFQKKALSDNMKLKDYIIFKNIVLSDNLLVVIIFYFFLETSL
jgi:hypothetical protein